MQFYFICEPNFNIFSLISFLASSLPQHRLQETDLHSITIEIREATIEEAIQVHNSIEEFQTNGWSTQAFEERYRGKDPLIIVCRHLYGPGEGIRSFACINEFIWLFWLVIIILERSYSSPPMLIIVGAEKPPIGYTVCYDRYSNRNENNNNSNNNQNNNKSDTDNPNSLDNSYYIWMSGVLPSYRRMGILTLMINYIEQFCISSRKYNKLLLKTRNNRREMLGYLIANRWNIIEVEKLENDVLENRILFERAIIIK